MNCIEQNHRNINYKVVPDTNQGKKIMRKLKNLMKALFCLMLVVVLFNSCDRTMKYFDASELEKETEKEIGVLAVNQYDVLLVGSSGECIFRDEQYEYEGRWRGDLGCIAISFPFLSNPPSIKFPDGKYAEHMLYIKNMHLYHNLEDMRKEKRRGRIKVKWIYVNDIAVDQFEKANERKKYK